MIGSLLIAASIQAALACHPIESDRIYGRDLAAVETALRGLPSDLEIGFAPVPGQQRIFRSDELTRIARSHGIPEGLAQPICFAWDLKIPNRAAVLAAMNETLAGRNATIEIVEQSNAPLPPGKLSFPLSGLSGTSDAPVIWRGALTYANGRTLLTWARVRISVRERHVAAAELLLPGSEIRADQLKLVDYQGPLTRDHHFSSIAEVAGMTPRSTVDAGASLLNTMLRERQAVERGDAVQVTVQTERTRIEAQGIAEESGASGSSIVVRNVKSGRKFQAKVQERGKVLVVPAGLAGLVTDEDLKSK
ncbi:MAG: flagellar basal body P-ring formation chaperone FlgA [Bryobacteraceae bacterium]